MYSFLHTLRTPCAHTAAVPAGVVEAGTVDPVSSGGAVHGNGHTAVQLLEGLTGLKEHLKMACILSGSQAAYGQRLSSAPHG